MIKKWETDDGFNKEGWWNRFLERHPQLSLRKGDALAPSRGTATNMDEYYSLLKTTLEEKDNIIMNYPSRICNMDESGTLLDNKPLYVLAHKGTKKIHCYTLGNKSQVTILACTVLMLQIYQSFTNGDI